MFFLQIFTDHSSTHSWTDHLWEMLFMLLGAFLLGYLLRYLLKPKDAGAMAASSKLSTGASAEWEQKIRDWENKYNVYVHNHETAVADWKLKVQGAEDRALTFSRQRDDVKTQLDKITTEQKSWNSELQQIRLAKSETEQKLNTALATIEKFEKKVTEEEAMIASLRQNEKEQTDWKKAIENLQQENEKLKAEAKSVRESVDGKDKRIIELLNKEALAKELQGRIDANANELLELRSKTSSLEQQLGGLADKDAQLSSLRNEKAALEQKLGALAEKEGEINKLRGEKNQLEQQLAAASAKDNEISKLQNEKSQLEQQASASAKDTGDLKAKLSEMEADRHRVAENLNQLRLGIDEEREKAKQRIAALEAEVERLKAEHQAITMKAAAPVVEALPPVPAGMKRDDLLVVEGVGPKVNELLQGAGIITWRALANKTADELRTILSNGGDKFRILNPNSWPKQAALLADGKWDEFKAYADYLIAGVEPSEVKKEETAAPKQPSKPLPAGIKWNDLKVIEGIGPAIEKLLHGAGITTFEELANINPDKIKEVLAGGGDRFRMHDPGTWPQQSKLAYEEEWDALKAMQEKLSAGKA
jgi:predicted flap endonuclease-1-like 5' DNA nuclease